MEKLKYYDIGVIPETTTLTERITLPFKQLNYLLNGLLLDRITLLTSSTDSGKTTVSSQIIINAVKQGYNTFYFAGEDGGAEARDRLYKQYTEFDKSNFTYVPYVQNGKQTNCGEYLLSHDKWLKANSFFTNKLFIFNNNLLANKQNLINTLESARLNDNCKFFVLDNVEMFDLDADNENASLKDMCIALRQWAISKKVHILIVAHIRKIERNICRPEIFDVKGSSALTNICKNIITIIRTDKLDKETKEYQSFARLLELNGFNLEECDSIMEVKKTKGRGLGFCGLKFNKYTQSYYEVENKQVQTEEKNIGEKEDKQLLYQLSAEEAKFVDDLF